LWQNTRNTCCKKKLNSLTTTQKSTAPTSVADDFLAADILKPAALLPLNFAEMSDQEALNSLIIVAANDVGDKFLLSDESLGVLRSVLQPWVESVRDEGLVVAGLLSPIAREQNLRQVIAILLDAAYATSSKAWTTKLPTGHQILIACGSAIDDVGVEAICRATHEQAIVEAQAKGLSFNAQALTLYKNLQPTEMH
jgi:hypothetical protein